MRVTLEVPDELYATYEQLAGQRRLPEEVMLINLKEFAQVRDGRRWLIVDPASRAEIERLLGGRTHILSPSTLVERIRQRVSIALGRIELTLSDAQLARIRDKARKQDVEPQVFLERVLKDVSDHLLGYVG